MDWRIHVSSVACKQVFLLVLTIGASTDSAAASSTDVALPEQATSAGGSECGVSDYRAIETELGAILGQSFVQFVARHLGECKVRLRPMYQALPKDERHHLGYAASSYSLRRYFAQRYGMRMQGLDAMTDLSASLAFVQHLAPAEGEQEAASNLLDSWRKHLHQCGFSLDDIALFAATLEFAIEREASGTLIEAFETHGMLPDTADWTYEQLKRVIETFTILRYTDGESNSSSQMQRQIVVGHRSVSHWADVQRFVHDVIDHVIDASGDDYRPQTALEFARIVAGQLTEHYGRHEDARSCHWMKSALFFRGGRKGGGRIRLPEFYRISNADHFPFSENDAHLRAVGALDESVSTSPRVVIPNYLGSNCFAGGSSLYQHCCVDECDALLGHIESRVQGPVATPDDLAAIVAAMPSATVSAPRGLPDSLITQLGMIAEMHGGQVPIHGRLFAQWLHLSFPNECPHQHATGAAAERQEAASADTEVLSREPAKRDAIRQHLATGFKVFEPVVPTRASKGAPQASARVARPARPEADAVGSPGGLPWSDADINFVGDASSPPGASRLVHWLTVGSVVAVAALVLGFHEAVFSRPGDGKSYRSVDDGPLFSCLV